MPPVVLALAGSALQNLLKTREDSPGFNPAPLSLTTTAIASSSLPISTSIGFPSPYSDAFEIRLRKTLSILR